MPNQGGTEYFREVQYKRIASTQVTVSTAATQLVAYNSARVQADICLMAAQAVYIGTSAVTVGTGALLTGTIGASLGIYTDQALYAVCSAGTVAVSVFESMSS